MSKAFTKESDQADEDPELPESQPFDFKNYVTPHGYAILQNELRQLLREERPKIVETVSWAAKNGDRSENGDYIYGKRRLREIDRRVRYLTKQVESAVVVDPKQQQSLTQVFFGATITYLGNNDEQKTIKLVGIDEADYTQNKISWISPIAKALLKSRVGDVIEFKAPAGVEAVTVLRITYEAES
jgi:transcription elongation factor GreB